MKLEQVADLLPESVKQIAELIGYPATARLLETFGGCTLPVSKGLWLRDITRLKLLQQAVGEETAALFVKVFGGEVLYLPRCVSALRVLRNRRFFEEFEELRKQGSSSLIAMTMLCPKYGFSDRFAWDVLAEIKAVQDNQQNSLF